MTSQDIRRQYIDFFVQKHGHRFVPSSSVVPHDDPTLLFTNAGMNQFKRIFLGEEKRDYTRAVNTQKCIRAGGKHNDLDDVGRSRRHHTFFEMLGNWSFGDYFKAEAIEWAWELLTEVWGIDKSRLHVTCYEGDEAHGIPRDTEAADLWKKIAGLDENHIHYFGRDNFWEMGDTGPCGPCSEIHIDRTPGKTGGREVNGNDPRVMEVWNLVFIQYNRLPGGKLTPLPARHVDTGMGFERICQVLQGKHDNYAIDLWDPFFNAIGGISGKRYGGTFPPGDTASMAAESESPELRNDIAFRVIADHLRMATFAITDGAVPSNKKRGAVLRSVIRRAVRFGYQVLGLDEPFMHRLVPVVVESMGQAFPELRTSQEQVQSILRQEETDFLSTIDRGLRIFEDAAARAKAGNGIIAGKDVFNLHATLGFPADLTVQLAQERGLSVEFAEYERLWREHVEISGQGRKTHAQVAVDLSGFSSTDDSPKYHGLTTEATVLGWVSGDRAVKEGKLEEDAQAALLLDRTTFYAEQGGQVGDVGLIQTSTGRFDVSQTERKGDWVLHWGAVAEGTIHARQRAQVHVDIRRADTMRNHTATHLLNWALRKVLGEHVEQKGSLVDAQRLRFDFSHGASLNGEQITLIERLVNEKIYADLPVSAAVMPLAQARAIPGIRAVFGEKYPDPVRVVAIGVDDPTTGDARQHSIEFCGGTHLSHTGQAGFFKIVSEESVSKGVRRITAVTGPGAVEFVQNLESSLRAIALSLSAPIEEAPRRIETMQEEIRTLRKKLASGAGSAFDVQKAAIDAVEKLSSAPFVIVEARGASAEQLLATVDSVKKRTPTYAVMLAAADDEKIAFVAAVSDDMVSKGLKAGDWIRDTAKAAGGGGGGRPQMAQAGGKDPSKLPDAIEAAKAHASRVLGA